MQGKNNNFTSAFLSSSGWFNNQINMRQSNRSEYSNLFCIYIQGLPIFFPYSPFEDYFILLMNYYYYILGGLNQGLKDKCQLCMNKIKGSMDYALKLF